MVLELMVRFCAVCFSMFTLNCRASRKPGLIQNLEAVMAMTLKKLLASIQKRSLHVLVFFSPIKKKRIIFLVAYMYNFVFSLLFLNPNKKGPFN